LGESKVVLETLTGNAIDTEIATREPVHDMQVEGFSILWPRGPMQMKRPML